LRGRFDIGDASCIRNAEEVILTINWGPECDLVVSADIPLEVKAPGLRGLAAVPKRFKGNFKLGRPAKIACLGFDLPIGIPI